MEVWRAPVRSWVRFGSVPEYFGRLAVLLGAFWRRPGAFLGRLRRVLGASWAVLEAFWGRLGGVLGRLGGVLGVGEASRGLLGASCGHAAVF